MKSTAPLRIVIVDDEALARSVLREYCSMRPGVLVVGECANGFEAVKAVGDLHPDLLLLDIQMPKLSGFEVLELLENPPPVVFVTAFDQFAIKAFEVHAVDYVLKPVRKERLYEAIDRVLELSEKRSNERTAAVVSSVREQNKPLERILVRDRSHVHVIPTETVDYIEARDDYVEIVTAARKFLKQQRLTELEGLLDSTKFVRIHRSFILNIDRLSKIEPFGKDSYIAVLKNGVRLNVSRKGYQLLKGLL